MQDQDGQNNNINWYVSTLMEVFLNQTWINVCEHTPYYSYVCVKWYSLQQWHRFCMCVFLFYVEPAWKRIMASHCLVLNSTITSRRDSPWYLHLLGAIVCQYTSVQKAVESSYFSALQILMYPFLVLIIIYLHSSWLKTYLTTFLA